MRTSDVKLAAALRLIGLDEMAKRAERSHYNDYFSPLDAPLNTLVNELSAIDTPEALALVRRVIDGDFDGTKEESDEWAKSEEGQDAFSRLMGDSASRMVSPPQKNAEDEDESDTVGGVSGIVGSFSAPRGFATPTEDPGPTGEKIVQAGRIAFRVEEGPSGDMWVAYFAASDSDEDRIWMGSVAMGVVQNPQRKKMFMQLMRHAVDEFFGREGMPVASWKTTTKDGE